MAAAKKKASAGSEPRTYVVLEELRFSDNEEPYYVVVHEVEARNNANALRKAFREMLELGREETEAILMVVPKSAWRPTPVSVRTRQQVVAA